MVDHRFVCVCLPHDQKVHSVRAGVLSVLFTIVIPMLRELLATHYSFLKYFRMNTRGIHQSQYLAHDCLPDEENFVVVVLDWDKWVFTLC